MNNYYPKYLKSAHDMCAAARYRLDMLSSVSYVNSEPLRTICCYAVRLGVKIYKPGLTARLAWKIGA